MRDQVSGSYWPRQQTSIPVHQPISTNGAFQLLSQILGSGFQPLYLLLSTNDTHASSGAGTWVSP